MDLQTIIEEMNNYASRRLMNVDVKQLDGKTPDDFTSNVLLKVLEGTFNWQEAATEDFKKFLFGCLRTEVSNFLATISRRGVSITEIMEDKFDFENSNSVIYATPIAYQEEDMRPNGYNNTDDEEAYYTGKAISKRRIKK